MRAVRVAAPVKKGEMHMGPFAPQVSVTKGTDNARVPSGCVDLGSACTHPVSGSDCNAYVQAKIAVASTSDAAEFLAPFWFVTTTQDPSASNMQLQLEEYKCGGSVWEVPTFVNTKALKENDPLKVYVKVSESRYPSFEALRKKAEKKKSA